jgi:rhomboid family GlyGly-CTERM serine protease
VLDGQLWRIPTCHLTHCSGEHLFWDLAMFLALGVMCERRSVRRWLACLLAAGLAIPLAVLVVQSELATYRGLSGVDTALFTLLAVTLLKEKWRQGDTGWLIAIAALLVALVGKTLYELLAGQCIFVNATLSGFQPVPLAHLVGAAIGIAVGGWAPLPRTQRLKRCRFA